LIYFSLVIGSPQANPRTKERSRIYRCTSPKSISDSSSCTTIPLPDAVDNSTTVVMLVEDNLDLLVSFYKVTVDRRIPNGK